MEGLDTLNETIEYRLKKQRKKERGRKKWYLLLAVLVAAAAAGCLFLYGQLRPKSRYELDRNALEGFLPGKTEAEIQAELNRIIAEGRVNISMNPTPVVKDGRINVRIENVPANHYLLQADVFLYPEKGNPDKAERIYSSGVIRQEYYIEEGEIEKEIEPGAYDGIAVFRALDPKTQEEIGSTSLTLVITVED